MSIEEIKSVALELLGAGGVSGLTWLLSSRARRAETVKTEISNVEAITKIYRDLSETLKGEIDELRHQVRVNEDRIHQLENENCALQLQVKELSLNRWG